MIDAIIILILIVIFYSIIRSFVKRKAKGISSCGCGCSSCAAADTCHSSTNK